MGIDKFYRKGHFPKLNAKVLEINGTEVTAEASELNLLDGKSKLITVAQVEVDCSAGGSAQTQVLATLPAGSILLNVIALVTETFDGATTKTFEVGVTANVDKYIDTADLGVTKGTIVDAISGTNNDQKVIEAIGTATEIKAFWTNTTGATAGKVQVTILYV